MPRVKLPPSADRIVSHHHCPVCTKAIPMEREFCSKKCEDSYNNVLRKRKMMIYLLYAMIAFFLAIMILGR